VNTICLIVALFAWCGLLWSNVRVAKQLRANGYSIWTFNMRARFNAWKGTNILLFLSCFAIFAAVISVMK
jgi:amino acid permease